MEATSVMSLYYRALMFPTAISSFCRMVSVPLNPTPQTMLPHFTNVLFSLWEPVSYTKNLGRDRETERECKSLLVPPLSTDIIAFLE